MITLSEKTEHDMTAWSSAVEDEREQLLEQVITSSLLSVPKQKKPCSCLSLTDMPRLKG